MAARITRPATRPAAISTRNRDGLRIKLHDVPLQLDQYHGIEQLAVVLGAQDMELYLFSFAPSRRPSPGYVAGAAFGVVRWLGGGVGGAVWRVARAVADDPACLALLDSLFGNIPYLGRCLLLEPHFARDLFVNGPEATFRILLEDMWRALGNEAKVDPLMAGLRQGKRHTALLVAVADIAEVWDVGQVTLALSEFADAALRLATRHLLRNMAAAGTIGLVHEEIGRAHV